VSGRASGSGMCEWGTARRACARPPGAWYSLSVGVDEVSTALHRGDSGVRMPAGNSRSNVVRLDEAHHLEFEEIWCMVAPPSPTQ
jgi:hypothetical protein